jgi:hypothetical protein
LPSKFWEEVVHDVQLGAILDIAAGDGSLTLTAVRHRLPYTGIVFTTHHRDLMKARLLEILSAGALTAGDKWYEPSLVKTLVAAAKKKKGETGEEPAKKKPKQDNHENISDIDREELDTKRNTKHKPKTKAKTARTTKKNKGQEGEREQQRCVFGSGQCGKQRGVGLRGRHAAGAPRAWPVLTNGIRVTVLCARRSQQPVKNHSPICWECFVRTLSCDCCFGS